MFSIENRNFGASAIILLFELHANIISTFL